MNKHLVFVYGSLRRGSAGAMSTRFPRTRFIADAKISGTLYDLGAYPGLLLDESSSFVVGELYEVDDETLKRLDDYEAPSLYWRKQVEVSVGTDRKTCWVYVTEQRPEFYANRESIASGDWTEYASTKTAWLGST